MKKDYDINIGKKERKKEGMGSKRKTDGYQREKERTD